VNGWLIIDKPVGPSSTRVVGAVKRALREGGYPKPKVGHGGTLDPLASGVLPVALGEATKLSGRMLDADKIYRFTIAFGSETDTLDAEGETIEASEARPSLADVEAALAGFLGEIEQVPPAYSALKIEGRPAYARARGGETLEMKPRRVRIHLLEVDPADAGRTGPIEAVTLVANVSKGTYIRSLARDIFRWTIWPSSLWRASLNRHSCR
jgi:tRNA pseudouridine55 synthase